MQDPFNIKDLKEDKNHYEFIKRVLALMIAKKISSEFNEDVNVLSDNIYNLISNGTFFNLPNNQIILGNNISLELTTSELEILKLLDLEKDKTNHTKTNKTNNSTNNTSINQLNESTSYKGLKNIKNPQTHNLTIEPTIEAILKPTDIINPFINNSSSNNITSIFITNIPPILNITECEKLIKKINNISEEEQLIIIKGTNYKDNGQYFGNEVIYQLFSTSLMKILSLEPCEEAGINIYITDTFYKNNLLTSPLYQSKIVAVIDNGYDIFSSESNFYNDICTPFTNENGNDVLLDERRSDYFQETLSICKEGCNFTGYNTTSNLYSCECPTVNYNNETFKKKKELTKQELPEDFYKRHSNSNIKVFKCFSQVFSSKGQKNNFGSYILLLCFISNIGVIIFHLIKGNKLINNLISKVILEIKPANPPKYIESKEQIEPNLNTKSINKLKKEDKKENHSDNYLNNTDFES